MSKKNNKVYKEVPRYQLIEIPAMFSIMTAIGTVIYAITACVSQFKDSHILAGVMLIITSVVALFTLLSCIWAVSNSNIPQKANPMIIITAAELAFFVFTFVFNLLSDSVEISSVVSILFIVLLSLQLAGAIVLKVKGTKIYRSLPERPAKVHKNKKKKKK